VAEFIAVLSLKHASGWAKFAGLGGAAAKSAAQVG
jgi:hypothetical protein